MRPLFLFVGLLAGFITGSISLPAQTPPAPSGLQNPAIAPQNRTMGFLSEADEARVKSAHAKALADNPELGQEEQSLRDSRPDFQTATTDELQAFMEKVRTYEEKMRQAMLKEDSTIGPILAQIDKHRSEMRAKTTGAPASAPAQ
jgi:hypothetical protein